MKLRILCARCMLIVDILLILRKIINDARVFEFLRVYPKDKILKKEQKFLVTEVLYKLSKETFWILTEFTKPIS